MGTIEVIFGVVLLFLRPNWVGFTAAVPRVSILLQSGILGLIFDLLIKNVDITRLGHFAIEIARVVPDKWALKVISDSPLGMNFFLVLASRTVGFLYAIRALSLIRAPGNPYTARGPITQVDFIGKSD